VKTQVLRAFAIAIFALGALFLPAAASAAPPSNDNFAGATVVDPSGLPLNDTVAIDEATTEPGESSCGNFPAQTVWYAITPTANGTMRATESSISYQLLTVYRQDGAGLGGLTTLDCARWYYGQNSTTFSVEAGRTYYIQAGTNYFNSGSMTVRLETVPPPANNNFANATSVESLPFYEAVDMTAADGETGEPACGTNAKTVWYAFTPSQSGSYTASAPYNGTYTTVAAYSGSTLQGLTMLGCVSYNQPLTIHLAAGTTYHFQLAGNSPGTASIQLGVAPAPNATFGYSPGDPSSLDSVQFYDGSSDPGGNGFSSEVWSFGDGSAPVTNPGCCFPHRFTADGDYTVKLTVTTTDGRTASNSVTLHVRTHDVSIARVSVPTAAKVGQSKVVTVGLSNTRYAETVQVALFKSTVNAGWQQVGVLLQYVPVRGGGRTTDFAFNYTFSPEDAALGKVNFQAQATIATGRDAFPSDNTFISLPTKVTG